MGNSNSRTLSSIIYLYEDSLNTNLKDLVFDIKDQLYKNGSYMIYGEIKVYKDTEITDEMMTNAECLFHTKMNCNKSVKDIEKMMTHYKILKNLLILKSEGIDKTIQGIASIGEPFMDDPNKKAVSVLKNDGIDKAIDHMFTRPDGSQRSYAEMRSMYG